MKPTTAPVNAQQQKKTRQEKWKKRGGEKKKSKSQDCCVTYKPKSYHEMLLSEPAWTLQAYNYFASGSEGRKVYDL